MNPRRSRKPIPVCILCFLLAVLLPCGTASAVSTALDADAVYRFAIMNFEEEEYATAKVEFRRFLFFFPADPRAAEAAFKVGMSDFLQNRFPQALNAFESVKGQYAASEYATEAVFMISRCYVKLNDTPSAVAALSLLVSQTSAIPLRDRALYRIGWIYLESGELSRARGAFAAISDKNRDHYRVNEIMSRLDDPEGIAPKNPVLSGLFGIVPGGGYFYNGLYREAAVAFFINAGLAAATYESFDNDLNVIGGLLSLLNLGFYSGSIYGGINAAHKSNRMAYDQFVGDLRKEITPDIAVRFSPTGRSVLLSFHFLF